MIVCPNCNHQNPDGAAQCEACYTPLPATTTCPNCGAPVQTDASFCGQCGFSLRVSGGSLSEAESAGAPDPLPNLPELENPEPLVMPDPLVAESRTPVETSSPVSPVPATIVSQPAVSQNINTNLPPEESASGSTIPPEPVTSSSGSPSAEPMEAASNPPPSQPAMIPSSATTQLQQTKTQLLHLQTNTMIELPQNISVIHVGKPNDQIPPDIDVSGFPNSEIVSRIHADIRVEGDAYYIEDVGSSNGTYINHTPLTQGNRHRLRPGDRIALGKGDLVTFLFQVS